MSKSEIEHVSADEIVVDGVTIKEPLKIKFSKPTMFEGNECTGIDLSALNDWTCDDLIKANNLYEKIHGNETNPLKAYLPEADIEYCFFLAAKAANKPIEFIKKLPAKEGKKIQTAIIFFFNSEV